MFILVICGAIGHCGNKNNLRTTEAQIVQKLKNNETRPNFSVVLKKMRATEKK